MGYAGENPLRFVDENGLEAYEKFPTLLEAVKDFGLTYNDDSIHFGIEFATTFYKTNKGDEYYYGIPNKGTKDSSNVWSSHEPGKYKDRPVAVGHTHGAYDEEYVNNEFSPNDIDFAENHTTLEMYVITPNGALKEYNQTTDETNLISNEMPSDARDPSRLNNMNFEFSQSECNEQFGGY